MKRLILSLTLMLPWLMGYSQKINIAPQATVTASNCSTGPCSALNDLALGTCGTQSMWISTSSPPSTVVGTDFIEWNWPNPQSFDEILIHHAQSNAARQLQGATMQSWNGSAWVTTGTFSGLPASCTNTISFNRVTTSRFRFTLFQMAGPGQTSNPNFREIEIFRASTSSNDAGVGSIKPLVAVCPATSPVEVTVQNYGTNRIDSVLVHWKVNGTAQTSVMYKGTTLDTIGGSNPSFANVVLGTYAFTTATNYFVEAWTTLPNNALDTSTFNDTIRATLRLGAPSGLAVSGVGSSTASVAWNVFPTTNYEIIYGLQGFDPTFSGTTVNSMISPYQLTGLTSNTLYDVYIVADCGSSAYSDTTGPETFRTTCVIATAPFVENFDGTSWVKGNSGGTGDAIDACWSRNSETGYKWSVFDATTSSANTGPSMDHTGGNYLYTESSPTTPPIAELISPPVDVSGLTTPYVSFYYHRYGTATTMGDMNVDINDGTGWSTLMTLTGVEQTSGTDPFTKIGVDVSAFGDTIRIRFASTAKSCCAGDMAIDLFEVKEAPSCPKLSGLDTLKVNDISAIIGWNASGNATQYQVWYGPQGFFQGTATNGGTKVLSTVDSVNLSSLVPQRCYEVLVRSICGANDTSEWIGPIVFCTDLGLDAQLLSIIGPDGCGSTTSQVKTVIRNNGDNVIGNFPISVNITGTISTSFNTTYTGSLIKGATDTVLMGTINTLNGALLNYSGYVSLSGDQISSNDSLRLDSVFTIPLDPVAYDTTFCSNQDTAVLLAYPVPGVTYNWFSNATDTVPLFTGNPFYIPMASAQPTYYVQYGGGAAGSLTSAFVGGNGQAGNAFDLLPLSTISITGIDIHVSTTVAQSVNIYYRTGTYVGFNTALAGWTLHETVAVTGAGVGTPVPVPFTNQLKLNGNQLYSMMVVLTTSTSIAYTNGTTAGAILAQNSDLIIYEGAGISWPLGSNFSPRYWNGTIYYGGKSCSTVRKPVNLNIGSDTSIAAFTATSVGGSAINFDATASVNADHYAWDFGDGGVGVGVTTSHTYAANGSYTVTLTVNDSTDCYSTSTADTTFLLNIGLRENAMERSIVIYPNPAKNQITVSFDAESTEMALRVLDLSGKEIMAETHDNLNGKVEFLINIGNLADGVYMIEVTNGELKAVKRLIKQ